MATLLEKVSFVFLVMETLIGMVANGSIVFINFIDWFRNRKLSPTDLILICLGSSRLLLLAVMFLNLILFLFLKNIMSNMLFLLSGIWNFINIMNVWFAACLSAFYLAKIAIFSHPVFLQFRRRLPGLMPWLLLGSVVFSAVVTTVVITVWSSGMSTCNPYKSLSSNRSNAEIKTLDMCWHVIVQTAVLNFVPFMVCLSSSICLISSLWKHLRSVQCNGTGTKDLNTQAHLSAIKALASFALLYLISFAAATSQTVLTWNNKHRWTVLLFSVSTLYPSGHGIILILINPKLKQPWVRMIHHFKCHLSNAPS